MKLNYKKHSVINDPIYGFIAIPSETIFELINHPYFQRLRRISQLGLTHLIYPGARHSRFDHAIGAMHLMQLSLDALKSKEVNISDEEAEAAMMAILLHDIGHGPFSHTLEKTLIEEVHHEQISSLLMDQLNSEMNGKLNLTLQIFRDQYHKSFLHQLVSSQLDMDRMDYLNRDSFFTGVSEGIVSYDRIIKKLNVVDNQLVVEIKGIYSVEKFITARRLMYWQVYLHKTTVGADNLISNILKRAKELTDQGVALFSTPSFRFFLQNHVSYADFANNKEVIHHFTNLDDVDILASVKVWMDAEDSVLAFMCKSIIERKLFKVELQNEAFSEARIKKLRNQFSPQFGVAEQDLNYIVNTGVISNNAYNMNLDNIKILFPDGSVQDIAAAADLLNISALAKPVHKYFLSYPK